MCRLNVYLYHANDTDLVVHEVLGSLMLRTALIGALALRRLESARRPTCEVALIH